MPITATYKNAIKMISPHLDHEEKVLSILLSGRTVLSLTSKKRLIFTSFPFFGISKITHNFDVNHITNFDFHHENAKVIINFNVNHKVYKIRISNSSIFPVNEQFHNLFFYLYLQNPKSKPFYLSENEILLDSLKTKNNIFKLTNKNIFIIVRTTEGKNVIKEKTSLKDFNHLDFYPENNYTIKLFLEKDDFFSKVITISHHNFWLKEINITKNSDELYNHIKKMLNNQLSPEYLNKNEITITTFKASKTQVGVLNPSIIIRFTNQRILELAPNKIGKPQILKETSFNQLVHADIIEHQSDTVTNFLLKIQLKNGENYKIWLNDEYFYALEKIKDLLKPFQYEKKGIS